MGPDDEFSLICFRPISEKTRTILLPLPSILSFTERGPRRPVARSETSHLNSLQQSRQRSRSSISWTTRARGRPRLYHGRTVPSLRNVVEARGLPDAISISLSSSVPAGPMITCPMFISRREIPARPRIQVHDGETITVIIAGRLKSRAKYRSSPRNSSRWIGTDFCGEKGAR